MRLILTIWLTLSAVAAPPLFRAQNQASAPATNVLDGFTHYWLADDIAGADGDPVGTWPDGIASNDATAAGSARPTLRTADINGKNSVEFDGVNDGMSVTAASSSGRTICVVWASSIPSGSARRLVNGTTDAQHVAANTFASGLPAGVALFNGSILSYAYDTSAWSYTLGVYDGSSGEIRVNGASVSTGAVGSNFPPAGFTFGYSIVDAQHLSGNIAFVGIRDGTPDPAFIAAFEAWAASYYGLP